MKNLLIIISLFILSGCAQYHPLENQCMGVQSTQQAYGYLNPNHYTIQVLALKTEADIQSYIQRINKNQPVWVNWKQSRGQEWFAVTTGNFPTKDAAYQAMNELPRHVQNSHPFLLSFGELQARQKTNVVRYR